MQDASELLNHQMSNSSGFTSGGTSPTQWMYDAADEDPEVSMNRVFWQASQPKDPALNQLMTDAYIPRKPPRIAQANSWTPSPGSGTSDASSSMTSPAERAARMRRQQKRRSPSATNVPQTAPISTRPENNFDKDIHKVVATFPLVSKQADESAKREQEALREKQRKQKRAARTLVEGYAVTKKHRRSADIKGKQRAADIDYEEEEMTVNDKAINEKIQQGASAQRSEGVQHNGLTHAMPPPSFVPLRKTWSNTAKSPSTFTDGHALSGLNSRKIERSAEAPSLSSSSSLATSTPLPPSGIVSNATHTHCLGVPPAKGCDRGRATNGVSVSVSASATSGPPKSQSSSHTPCPAVSSHSLCANPTMLPPMPEERVLAPQPTPAPLPKPNGPPALGMRRPVNSQAPSSSQTHTIGRSLPLKQDKFKVPFAKNRPEHQPEPAGAAQQTQFTPSSQSTAPSGIHDTSAYIDAVSLSSTSALDNHGQESGPATRVQPSQTQQNRAPSASSSKNRHIEDAGVSAAGDGRSSPPPAEADSSIDFDMGIDLDELERACSVYD